MSRVRLLVGTRKGAFIPTADAAAKNRSVSGPHFAGWELYHLKGRAIPAVLAIMLDKKLRPTAPRRGRSFA